MKHKTFGIVGLGKMGGGLALHALEKGWKVVGYTLGNPSSELLKAGLTPAHSLEEFKNLLPHPRVVMLYIPAGPSVDTLIDSLKEVFQPDDIIVDGGNSYWGDSIQRHARLKEVGIHLLDLGTSGGYNGARNGACFMVGGDTEPVKVVYDLLTDLAIPGGLLHTGPSGSGHYTKLVHNGIEFGMLQAIGEGVQLLESWPFAKIPVADLLRSWCHGSVIRSWLIELMEQGYREHRNLEKIPSYVEDTGEVNWLVSDAVHMEIPIPVITQSIIQLFSSRDSKRTWARAISVMRHGFGGHPLGPSEPIVEERKTGRIGDPFLKKVA